jgi:hypothetical protein
MNLVPFIERGLPTLAARCLDHRISMFGQRT